MCFTYYKKPFYIYKLILQKLDKKSTDGKKSINNNFLYYINCMLWNKHEMTTNLNFIE